MGGRNDRLVRRDSGFGAGWVALGSVGLLDLFDLLEDVRVAVCGTGGVGASVGRMAGVAGAFRGLKVDVKALSAAFE
jgi:hypothetical protein